MPSNEIKSNTVYIVDCGPMERDYYTMDADGSIRAHHSYKRAELFAGKGNKVEAMTLDEWRPMLQAHEALQVANEITQHGSAVPLDNDPEVKWMINCNGCGEVFDDIQAAARHDGTDMNDERCIRFTETGMVRSTYVFSLVREDEAF